MPSHHAYVDHFTFGVMKKEDVIFSHFWYLKADGTSFYIGAQNSRFMPYKFSLHGKDPRPGKKPTFKFDSFYVKNKPQTTYTDVTYQLPLEFPGHELHEHIFHLLRFRFEHDLFRPGVDSAPRPKDLKKGRSGGVLAPPPTMLDVIDVDIYLSRTGRPFWPSEAEGRKENALIGPLKNQAHEILTAQVSKRKKLGSGATPPERTAPIAHPESRSDTSRAIAISGDDNGVLWIVEVPSSKRALEKASRDRFHETSEPFAP